MQEIKQIIPEFIQKIINMMKQRPDLINWSVNGQELVILNQKQFEKSLLSQHFRHGKLQSLVRQLNMYGFHKICRNKNCINFRNRHFFRGNEQNFHLIKRRQKNSQQQEQSTVNIEQNFIKFISQKHDKQFPQLSTIIRNILDFKQRNNKTVSKLKKTIDTLNKQLKQKKAKALKPNIIQIKQMISSIQDIEKKTQITIQKFTQQFQNQSNNTSDSTSIKKQSVQSIYNYQNGEIKSDSKSSRDYRLGQQIIDPIQINNNGSMQPIISHPIGLNYPQMHSSIGYFNTVSVLSSQGILGVSSHCSFNSVTSSYLS